MAIWVSRRCKSVELRVGSEVSVSEFPRVDHRIVAGQKGPEREERSRDSEDSTYHGGSAPGTRHDDEHSGETQHDAGFVVETLEVPDLQFQLGIDACRYAMKGWKTGSHEATLRTGGDSPLVIGGCFP
jgi:hypothetical protein